MAAIFKQLLRDGKRGARLYGLCKALWWVSVFAGFVISGIAYGDSSTIGIIIGLGLLALAPAFYALKRIVAAHLPEDHELHRDFSLPMMLLALAVSLTLAVILFIDPWLLEPVYSLMLLIMESD